VIPQLKGNDQQQHARLQKELKNIDGIVNFTFCFGLPDGGEPREFGYQAASEVNKTAHVNYVDQSFVPVFQLDVMAGRNFSGDQPSSVEVMVNESLIKELGFVHPEEAVGSMFYVGDEQVKIQAVIKNFYTQSLSNDVDPVILRYDPTKNLRVVMNISTTNISETIDGIQEAWKNVYPDFLCKYEFMDEVMGRQYGFFNTVFTFMGIASVIAIFIGSLGMYGLISFMAVQRTKEIGIRKVFGATVRNIIMMFTRESGLLILISFAIAVPVAHFFGKLALSEFPERIPQGFGIYAVTLVSSLFIAFLTVSYRSFMAAIQNPVETLKAE